MRNIVVCLLAFTFAGCLGISPEEARRRSIGDGDEDREEEHNPGTPCLACHDRDFNPGDDVFAVAGTVFLQVEDPDTMGLAGVSVFVRDARGREFEAITNDAGNFMFEVKERDRERIEMRGQGKTRLSFWPEYPLETWIEQGGIEQRMETLIERDGSCATCHDGDPSARSVGRVFLMETP